MPNFATSSLAILVGAIKLDRPDLSAFAPSAADTPPSRMAVSKTAKSCTLPPSPLITGATRGIA